MVGLTFDTGALIALERRDKRMRTVLQAAAESRARITVPTAVVAEWWRARTDVREDILASIDEEPLLPGLAKVVGEAMAVVRGASIVDAIVMASAAQRGDIVYTSDHDDLERLRRCFPSVRLLRA